MELKLGYLPMTPKFIPPLAKDTSDALLLQKNLDIDNC